MDNQGKRTIALHQTVLTSSLNVSPLFLLTIPKDEVARGETEDLTDLLDWLLGGAGPTITFERWAFLWKHIRNKVDLHEIDLDLEHLSFRLRYLNKYLRNIMEYLKRLRETLDRCLEPGEFVKQLISGMLSVPVRHVQVPVFGIRFRSWYMPVLYATAPVAFASFYLSLNLELLETSEEEVLAWTVLTSLLARHRSPVAANAIEDFLKFEIPFSRSKETSKSRLEDIISQARIVAFVPLAPAAIQTSNLIGQGQFLMALEVALTGAAVTLLMASTFSMAEFILNLPKRRRR